MDERQAFQRRLLVLAIASTTAPAWGKQSDSLVVAECVATDAGPLCEFADVKENPLHPSS